MAPKKKAASKEYELKIENNKVDNLTAGSLAVSDFRHDFWKSEALKPAEGASSKAWDATHAAVLATLPECEDIAHDPKAECTGVADGGYRRIDTEHAMRDYLKVSWKDIQEIIQLADVGDEFELPGSVFPALKYKVRVLSKNHRENVPPTGFKDILPGHKLGFVVDTKTKALDELIQKSFGNRNEPLIWINNNAIAFDPASKSYPGSGDDERAIGRSLKEIDDTAQGGSVQKIWEGRNLPYRDIYEDILYSPWPAQRGPVSLNDPSIENNLFFSIAEITQRRERLLPGPERYKNKNQNPTIEVSINHIKWTIPITSIGWVSAQITNIYQHPNTPVKMTMTADQARAEQLRVPVGKQGRKKPMAGSFTDEQFKKLSAAYDTIQETPIPGYLALSKRLGDQGQALSCRRAIDDKILQVFVTIDQLAFVAAVMYNIKAAIFCGRGDQTFMIYKESLDAPVLRLGNIIENFKLIKPLPSLLEMNKRADHLLKGQTKIMKGEWEKIAAHHENLEDETQYKNFLRKIISLDATSNIIKDVTNVQKKIAKLHMPGGPFRELVDALSNPDPPPSKDGDEVAPAPAALASILKDFPDLIPRDIQDTAFLGDTNSGDKGAIQARSVASIANLQKAAVAALGIQLRDFTKGGNVTLRVAADLLKRVQYAAAPDGDAAKITKAFAEHPKLLDPLYAWLADQADEYLGFMKTLISLNNLLDAAAKSAEEQAGKPRPLGEVNSNAIDAIRLQPFYGADGAAKQRDKAREAMLIHQDIDRGEWSRRGGFKTLFGIRSMQETYSGVAQLKLAYDILASTPPQQEIFKTKIRNFLTKIHSPPPRWRERTDAPLYLNANEWITQIREFIFSELDWTEGGGGGGGDSGEQGGGGRRKKHQKGGNKFLFKNDEIIRTYAGIVLVTMDLVAESDAVDRANLDNEMRKGLSTFLGGDIAVDNAIAAVNYAFTQDEPDAASMVSDSDDDDDIQLVKGGIFSPTFYNQLKRLNLEVGNGEHLLQYLRQNILKVSSRPALIYLPGDEINIKPMVESLQRQVKTSLEAYGFTAAAPPTAAATTPPRVGTPTPRAAAAPPPPQPPKSGQQAPGSAETRSQKLAEKYSASQTGVDELGSDSDSESESEDAAARIIFAQPSAQRRRVRAGKGGGKRKKKRTRRRKPKKRRKRSKKKRQPKKKRTRRRKPKKKRTRRRRR